MPDIPELRKLRQKNCEFKDILGCIPIPYLKKTNEQVTKTN
jgi:hypothetical protein